jgi:hypothetical protein
MWILDLLANLFAPIPGGSSTYPRSSGPAESVVLGTGTVLLPVIAFIVVLFADLWKDSGVALIAIPAACVGVTALLALALRLQTLPALRALALTALSGLVASGVAFLLGAITGFYETF